MRLSVTAFVFNIFLLTVFSFAISVSSQAEAAADAQAGRDGLLALYAFNEGSGSTVHDVSGVGAPANLRIRDAASVRWLNGGGLTVARPTLIATDGPASKITAAVKISDEVTIEAWIEPASTTQKGPARIVSLSADPDVRNVTLAQEQVAFDMRFRSTATDDNGMPSLRSPVGTLSPALTHVVYTRDAGGIARLYVNGVKQSQKTVGGDLSNWDSDFRLALANELTDNRPWLGTFIRVALYNRALSVTDVDNSFAAGPHDETGTATPPDSTDGAGPGSADDGAAADKPPAVDDGIPAPVDTGTATISWLAPVARADGDQLTPDEIAGYTVYYGLSAGNYSHQVRINDSFATSTTITDLPVGTYYFVLTTRDTGGRESDHSNMAIKRVK